MQEYGAGVFYLYLAIDADKLVGNLPGEKDLAANALDGLVEAALTVSPKGKQNSFASRAYASYALAELGTRAPRTLAGAFVRPVGTSGENDFLTASIKRLGDLRTNFDAVYGPCSAKQAHLDAVAGTGSLADIKFLAREAVDAVKR